MKSLFCFLTLVILGGLPAVARDVITRQVEKTFAVQPGGTLKVETQGGDITVRSGPDDQVKVIAYQKIRARNEAEADTLLQKFQLEMVQSGNDVAVTTKSEKRPGFSLFGLWPAVQVRFEITVPADFNAQVRTSGGDIVVGDFTGAMEMRTSGGDVSLGKIEGAVKVHTSGGDIHLAQASGGADLRTSGGDIIVGRVGGPLEAGTSGGDIKIDSAEGTIKAQTNGGDVTVRFLNKLLGDCALGTNGGDIHVTMDSGTAFNLDAATSGGEVEADGLTIAIERGGIGKSRLAGAANGGGPQLKLRTRGGDIMVKAD